jgi:hypothetical protein
MQNAKAVREGADPATAYIIQSATPTYLARCKAQGAGARLPAGGWRRPLRAGPVPLAVPTGVRRRGREAFTAHEPC